MRETILIALEVGTFMRIRRQNWPFESEHQKFVS